MKKPTLIALLILSIVAPAKRLKGADVSDLEYFNNGSFVTITDCARGAVGELIIPNRIDGLPVKIIDDLAFSSNKLSRIVIPQTVTTIGRSAFSSNEANEIIIPEGIRIIRDTAFFDMNNITTINLPESLQKIEGSAFRGCDNLKTIKLPKGINEISSSLFGDCINLETIIGLEHVRKIKSSAFSNCKKLKRLDLSNIDEIEAFSFMDCDALEIITIGGDLERLGSWAFWNCISLSRIYFLGDSPSFSDATTFENVFGATIYITPNAEGFGNTYAGFPVVVGGQQLVDSDNDGVADDADAFPNDPNETADSDNDGVGDNADARTGEQIAALQAQIDELSARPTLAQLTDARGGSLVINSKNGQATITFNIEESEDLKDWQKTGEKITKTIQLKEGKKFYRFALDK